MMESHGPVAIVDTPNRPGIASRAAAGMLAPYAEFHEESPLFHLCRASLLEYSDFLAHFAPNVRIDETGVLIPEDEAGRSAGMVALARKYARAEQLDAAALAREEPALSPAAMAAAWRISGAVIDPRRLYTALRETFLERGGQLLQGSPERIDMRGGAVAAVHAGGVYTPDLLVLSTGAWSRGIGDLLGLSPPIVPVKGQVGRVAVPDGALRHVIHSTEIYLAPRAGAGILFGATMEYAGFDDTVQDKTIAELKDRAGRFMPRLAGEPVAESWSGFRPCFPDLAPAIGWSSVLSNLLIATGHFRNGILLTPATGRMIAAAVAEGRDDSLARDNPFAPGRLGL